MKYLEKLTHGHIPPSFKLVLLDLLAPGKHNLCEFLSHSSESGISSINVLASMINLTILCDMNTPEQHLYGTLEIVIMKEGLGLCQYKAFLYDGQLESLISKNSWTTTLTPSGAITYTHMDCYDHHQYIVHLFGCKL